MLLAFDVGNTNITIGLFEGESLVAQWRVATDVDRTEDEYAALLKSLFYPEYTLSQVDGFCISSVVPATMRSINRFVEKFLAVKHSIVLNSNTKLGIKIFYEPKTDVGPDRLANAVAAHEKYGGPAIMVDFGTATTIDAISANGDYLGGAILPGIEISLQALFSRAARLQRVQFVPPVKAIGKSTAESLRSGVLLGTGALVDGMVKHFRSEIRGKPKVIATGGLADAVAGQCKSIDIVDQSLTLHGLRIVYSRAIANASPPSENELDKSQTETPDENWQPQD